MLRLAPVFLALLIVLPLILPLVPTAKAEGITLRVITRHDTTIQEKAKAAFLASSYAKKYGITDIIFLSDQPQNWIKTINLYKSRGTPMDVAWGGGPTLFDQLMVAGYLAPLKSESLLNVVKELPDKLGGSPVKRYDDQGNLLWVGAAISSFGFTINKKVLQENNMPVPSKWEDLANEVYAKMLPAKPMIGVADAPMSTSNTRIYQIIIQALGWEKGWSVITRMGANARIYDASDSVREGVISGEIGIGITIDFYGYIAEHKNPDTKYIIPRGESIINADPIAMLKTTEHPEAAQAFIEWVLRYDQGQKIWLDTDINRLPIDSRVFNTTEGKQRPDLEKSYEEAVHNIGIKFNDTLALKTETAVIQFFHYTITVPQQKLQRAWKALVDAKESGKISEDEFNRYVDELTNPSKLKFKDPETGEEVSFTLDYAMKANQKIMKSSSYATKLFNEWSKAAAARYDRVYSEITGATTAAGGGATTPQGGGMGTTTIAAIVVVIIIIVIVAAYLLKRRP